MTRWIALRRASDAAGFSAFMERGRSLCGGLFERPFVSWRNDVALLFMGPPGLSGYSAIDISGPDRGRGVASTGSWHSTWTCIGQRAGLRTGLPDAVGAAAWRGAFAQAARRGARDARAME